MRLVSINLRDYPGSTPYSPDEIAELRSTESKNQASFMRSRGIELAMFLAWYIRKEKIPPRTDPPADNPTTEAKEIRSHGGLTVLGWSSGNCMSISLFAHSDTITPDTKIFLDKYIRSCILLGKTVGHDAIYRTI